MNILDPAFWQTPTGILTAVLLIAGVIAVILYMQPEVVKAMLKIALYEEIPPDSFRCIECDVIKKNSEIAESGNTDEGPWHLCKSCYKKKG